MNKKRAAVNKPFVLVGKLDGPETEDVYPKMNGLLETITTDQSETPVYDARDNAGLKMWYWRFVLGREFKIKFI